MERAHSSKNYRSVAVYKPLKEQKREIKEKHGGLNTALFYSACSHRQS